MDIPNNWTSGIDYANYPHAVWNYYDNPTINQLYGLSRQQSAHIGAVYVTFTSISIVIYIRLIYIICFTDKLWARPAYKLIVGKGVLDILYIFGWFIGGLCSIFDSRFTYWLIKIIGATMIGSIGGLPIILLLALNRILQMVFTQRIVNMIYIAISWLLAFALFAIFVSPIGDFLYYPIFSTWLLVLNKKYAIYSEKFAIAINYLMIVTFGTTGIIYTILIIYIIVMKSKLEIAEIRLTIQLAGAVLFGVLAAVWNLWGFSIHTGASYYATFVISSLFSMGISAVDPYFYAFLNRTIRTRMLPKQCCKSNEINVLHQPRLN